MVIVQCHTLRNNLQLRRSKRTNEQHVYDYRLSRRSVCPNKKLSYSNWSRVRIRVTKFSHLLRYRPHDRGRCGPFKTFSHPISSQTVIAPCHTVWAYPSFRLSTPKVYRPWKFDTGYQKLRGVSTLCLFRDRLSFYKANYVQYIFKGFWNGLHWKTADKVNVGGYSSRGRKVKREKRPRNDSIHPSMYLLTKCQHNANNNATDDAKWSIEQKRETLCWNFGPP